MKEKKKRQSGREKCNQPASEVFSTVKIWVIWKNTAESATLPPPLNLIYWTVPRARGREEEAREGAQKWGERRRRKWRGGRERRDMKRDRGGEEQRERDLSEETALAEGGDAEQKKRRGGGRSGFENGGRGGDGESSPTVCRLLLARGSFAPSDWGRKKGREAQTRPHHRHPTTLGAAGCTVFWY